jgi:hypothetical protein
MGQTENSTIIARVPLLGEKWKQLQDEKNGTESRSGMWRG